MTHLDKAKQCAALAAENSRVRELSQLSTQRAIMHALIDIAESLHAPEPQSGDTWSFGGKVVRTVKNLADYALEHVGGCGDDDEDDNNG